MVVTPEVLDTVDLLELPDTQLEEGICGFAARLAAATCVWLLAIAEYDRREAWKGWGCHSMAHWLTWKCAMSPAAARDHVRVGQALRRLPEVQSRFREGWLSYSQVRAITRVATAATEQEFVDLARGMTAAQLETVVRGYKRSMPNPDPDTRPVVRRSVDVFTDDDGSLVGSFRLPAEVGALVMKALEVATEALRADGVVASNREEQATTVADAGGATRADALAEMASRYLEAVSGADRDDAGSTDEHYLVTVVAEQRVLDAPPDAPVEGLCQIDGGAGLDRRTVEYLLCDQPTVTILEDQHGNVLDVGRRTRRVNRSLRRALRRRDGHCQYPGCTTKARTQAHHLQHWAKGGPTTLDNLVLLCSHHHHRHHEGLFSITRVPDGGHRFTRSDGRTIDPVGGVQGCTDGPDPGVEPVSSTCQPDWDGSVLRDVSWIVAAMLQRHGLIDDALPADHQPSPEPRRSSTLAFATVAPPSGGGWLDEPDADERARWPDGWPSDEPGARWPGE